MRAPQTSKADAAEQSKVAAPTRGQGGSQKRNPELEAALGARIRAARVAARMSQGALGAAVGVTFQQVQKYENGRDRITVSTLQGIAAALGVHPRLFLDEDMPVPAGDVKPVREAMAVAADWQRIKNPETRKGLAKLIATLARESHAEPDCEG